MGDLSSDDSFSGSASSSLDETVPLSMLKAVGKACFGCDDMMKEAKFSDHHQILTVTDNWCRSPKAEPLDTDGEVCFACGDSITERYLLKVSGRAWHVHCLRCCVCQGILDRQTTCFIKEDNIYCKIDYTRQFGTKCSKCFRSIQSNDWVRRAKEHVYHLACFACDSCKRQLSTGEEFALQENKVLCKTHYIEIIEGGPKSDSEGSQKNKSKRVRTTFTEEQLQVLQANFQLDSNPDGQDLERIAQITGLSKRVTQVWFQNNRARQKKHQTGTNNNDMTSPVSTTPSWQSSIGRQTETLSFAS